MLTAKSLVVWAAEMLCEVALFVGLLLIAARLSSAGNTSGDDVIGGLSLLLFGTLLFMVVSGYGITTAIAAAVLRRRARWVYPLVSAVLFLACEQVFASGWSISSPASVLFQIAGAVSVFGCTFAGNLLWRAWTKATG